MNSAGKYIIYGNGADPLEISLDCVDSCLTYLGAPVQIWSRKPTNRTTFVCTVISGCEKSLNEIQDILKTTRCDFPSK